MKLERLPDWRTRLSRHIEENRSRPFTWGAHDCCLWVCDCIEVMTGVDIAAPYRGLYDDALGAIRALRFIDNVKTVHGVALKRIGPAKPPAFARAGDAVAADLTALGLGERDGTGVLSLGICFGATCYFVGSEGLVEVPTLSVEHAYSYV